MKQEKDYRKFRNCFEFLQKSFSRLDAFVFVCTLGNFLFLSVSVLRQIAHYLPPHTNGNASKTHYGKFKTIS